MRLENKRLPHLIKSARMALLCGFITVVACLANCAADTATNATAKADASPRLVIVNAVYGSFSEPAATTDVTAMVAAMVTNDTLDMHPENGILGGDIAPGIPKELKVDYTIDGVAGAKRASEGARLRISANPNPVSAKNSRLVIVKALYGDLPMGNASDVTADVADMVENDALEVAANNGAFGDPAFGKVKTLRVDYTVDGRMKSRTIQEGDTLKISPSLEQAQNRKRMFFVSLWIVSGILAVSGFLATMVLLARQWKK